MSLRWSATRAIRRGTTRDSAQKRLVGPPIVEEEAAVNPAAKVVACEAAAATAREAAARLLEKTEKETKEVTVSSEEAVAVPLEDDSSHDAWMAAIGDLPANRGWILDSGATNHMTPDQSLFTSISEIGVKISTADGFMEASGAGPIWIQLRPGERPILVQRAYYVPALQYNLLSVGTLAKHGIITVATAREALLVRQGEAIGRATRSSNRYVLESIREDARESALL